MKHLSDQELLGEYAGRRSEAAFAELTRRYVDLVHSIAFRMVRDVHLAQDVAQAVFVALACQAAQLTEHRVLAGWLHRTTRNLAANAIRSDVRRGEREKEAATMNETLAHHPDPVWEDVSQHLDEALAELNEADRDAVLLRYFERKTAREMAQIIGSSEEAAQKRVSRAVERLREALGKRGITVSAGALALAISNHAVQAAPAGLAATISLAVTLGEAALQSSTAIATTNALAMTTLQKTLLTTVLVTGLAVPLVIQQRDRTRLNELNQNLRQQVDALAAAQRAANVTTPVMTREIAPEEKSELLRLRGEVGVLRRQVQELEALRAQAATSGPKAAQVDAGKGGAKPDAAETIASAKAIILNAATGVEEKVAALRILRAAGERPDEVVSAMVRAYHATANPEWQADIFRQLNGVVNPELRVALLEAVANGKLDRKVREEATETLTGYLPDPDVKQWLEYLVNNETDEKVRAEAGRALANYERKVERKMK
ncbi:MAG: polymerase, sigma-24 subunit, subfamily [Verrucomicrobia bacterium]|jgi:RNA polymerase sigma factor (sigma-70 family)|nr:polymerase, sigma-24 subunit, subfamily [Verrucomicrobiota bacterium]